MVDTSSQTKRHLGWILLLCTLLALVSLAWIPFRVFPRPGSQARPFPAPVRAIRMDFLNLAESQGIEARWEPWMQSAGINMVALGAGRPEWTYFPWAGHSAGWSSDVAATGVDYLMEGSSRFSRWAHVNAVVDVLSPVFVQVHPDRAAVSADGVASPRLVSLAEMTGGEYGREVLAMVGAIAAEYPVQSVTLSELNYRVDGFGEDDRKSFLGFCGCADWPQLPDGRIAIDDPAVGAWRAQRINGFLDQAAAILHRENKLLFVETRVFLDPTGAVSGVDDRRLRELLPHADRVLLQVDADSAFPSAAQWRSFQAFLSAFGPDHFILELGLWSRDYPLDTDKAWMTGISAEELASREAMLCGIGAHDTWITPGFLFPEGGWKTLAEGWAGSSC